MKQINTDKFLEELYVLVREYSDKADKSKGDVHTFHSTITTVMGLLVVALGNSTND